MTDQAQPPEPDLAKLRRQIDRGSEAERILKSGLVKEFFTKMRDQLRHEWEASAPADSAARDHQWRLHQAVVLLEDLFKATIQNGQFAEKALKAALNADKPGIVARALRRVV